METLAPPEEDPPDVQWLRYYKRIQRCPCCGTYIWHVGRDKQVERIVSSDICSDCKCEACVNCIIKRHSYVHCYSCDARR